MVGRMSIQTPERRDSVRILLEYVEKGQLATSDQARRRQRYSSTNDVVCSLIHLPEGEYKDGLCRVFAKL